MEFEMMQKKDYIAPEINEVELSQQGRLLSGSECENDPQCEEGIGLQ